MKATLIALAAAGALMLAGCHADPLPQPANGFVECDSQPGQHCSGDVRLPPKR